MTSVLPEPYAGQVDAPENEALRLRLKNLPPDQAAGMLAERFGGPDTPEYTQVLNQLAISQLAVVSEFHARGWLVLDDDPSAGLLARLNGAGRHAIRVAHRLV